MHATGSAGTQAGLVLGFEAMNSGIPVYGVGVNKPKDIQEQNVYELARRTAEFMGYSPDLVARDKIVANSDYVGDGYGLPTNGMVEAVDDHGTNVAMVASCSTRFTPARVSPD